MAKVWDKPITAETDWGGDASTDNLPVSGRQVQAWIKSNIKSDAQISQLLVSWLNTHTINSPVFWKGLPIDADTLSWDGDKLTVIGSDGIDEQFLINFLQENGYLTKGDYPFVYDAEKKAWLFTGDLVATGAITMFGDFNKFKPSTIMDAVQVDDITIGKTAEGVLYAKSGGGSGGSGMSYEEINQIVSNAIQNKADKATTLEGYGIENAYDKSYIDTLAYKLTTVYNWGDHSKAGYVFKDTKQDISARHNFSDGLQIGGITIRKSQDGVVYIDGNLVIKGALTMFGTDATIPSSIWASIPFDSTMKWDGSKWSVVGSGSGSVDDAKVNVLISEYLAKNSYATQEWVTNKGYITSSALNGYATQDWVTGKKYLTGITSSQVTTALGFTPYDSTNPDKYIKGINYDMVIAALGYTPYSTTNPMGYLTTSSLLGYATEQWVGDNYLAKSGGTISGTEETVLKINTSYAVGVAVNFRVGDKSRAWVGYNTLDGVYLGDSDWGYTIRIGTDGKPYYRSYELIHLGNYSKYALPIKGGAIDNIQVYSTTSINPLSVAGNNRSGFIGIGSYSNGVYSRYGLISFPNENGSLYRYDNSYNGFEIIDSNNIGSYNAGSATKLQTPRTIWGQSFDGTGDISGLLTDVDGIQGSTTDGGYIGDRNKGLGATDGGSMIYNYSASPITFHINGSEYVRILPNGNVAIGGTTADAKLDIYGNVKASYYLTRGGGSEGLWQGSQFTSALGVNDVVVYGNTVALFNKVAVGRWTASATLHVGGDIIADGAITMFSQLSMKNVIDYDGLSLAQLAQIRPARFTWKDGRDNRIHVGGIADYIQPILPEVVYETVNKELTVDYGSAAFYVGASLIKPVVELWEAKDNHEKRIAELERENKRKDEVIAILQNELNQLRA